MRKETSRAPRASCSAAPRTSAAEIGGAASTAASSASRRSAARGSRVMGGPYAEVHASGRCSHSAPAGRAPWCRHTRTRGAPMDVTIIGTGNMARGIATRALEGGNAVQLLGTTAEKAQALAGELQGDVRPGQVGDPLEGDVVVLAVWYQAVDDVLARYGDQLGGKVVVDITNPVDTTTYAPLTIESGSV